MDVLKLLNYRLNQVIMLPATLHIIRLIALSYSALAAPRLPKYILYLFEKDWFKVLFLSLMAFIGLKDILTSLILGVGFVLTINYISQQKIMEEFRNEQNTNIYPGCLKITVNDLLNAFDGDANALNDAIDKANVPHNIRVFDDFYAPQIATYLANSGVHFKNNCSLS